VVVEAVHEVAAARGLPAARVALAWLLQRPGVVAPIVGATKAGHVDDAVAAVDVVLGEHEIRRLEEPYRPHQFRGHS
jgi:aryl-alcohol dehydrogenase-like predicted oxidoreductase